MAHSRRKTSSQLPSRSDDTFQHTSVTTPEIEVSLVDRMKKHFSTQNPSIPDDSSTDSDPNGTSSASPSQNSKAAKKGSRKQISKQNSLGQKVTQIDKFFSPDTRSNKVFRSPTRFQSKSGLPSSATASSESDDAAQTGTKRHKTRSYSKRNRENSEDGGITSRSSVEKSTDDSDHGHSNKNSPLKPRKETPAPSVSKKRRSDDADNSQSSSMEEAEERRHLDGGRSDEDAAGVPQMVQVQETEMARRNGMGKKRKGSAVVASGELSVHMADKEFIGNQVRVISTPFVLESGPRSWMQVWKGQQSSHDDVPRDIPASVMSRIVTKINFHMEDVYQRWLGRQQQRDTLIRLDELRKDTQNQKQCNLKMDVKNQASLQEIISSYPSEWPGAAEAGSDGMTERYSALRARLFALSRSLSVTRQQCDQYKSLAGALERIDSNLEKYSSLDLQAEMERTGMLVSKIQQKLLSGDLGQKRGTSCDDNGDDGNSESTNPSPPTNHAALVRMLFQSAGAAESP